MHDFVFNQTMRTGRRKGCSNSNKNECNYLKENINLKINTSNRMAGKTCSKVRLKLLYLKLLGRYNSFKKLILKINASNRMTGKTFSKVRLKLLNLILLEKTNFIKILAENYL